MNQIESLSLQNKDKSLKIVNVCLNKVQLENIIRRQDEELKQKDQRVKSLQVLLKERTQKINKMNVSYFQMEEEITQHRRSIDVQSIQQQKISELEHIIRLQQEEIQNYLIDHARYLQFIEQIYQSNHIWFEERSLLYEYREELQKQVQQVENINQALISSNYHYETQLNQQNEQGNDLLGQIQYMIECCQGVA